MNRTSRNLSWLLFLSALASAGAAFSQTPLGREFRINQRTALNQASQQLAAAPDGGFAVVWSSLWDLGGVGYTSFATARFYDPQGKPAGDETNPGGAPGSGDPGISPFVTRRPGEGFRLFWVARKGGVFDFRLLETSASGAPLGDIVSQPLLDPGMTVVNFVGTPSGRNLLAWLPSESEVKMGSVNPRGELLGEEITIAKAPDGAFLSGLGVGLDGTGVTVAVWAGNCADVGDFTACDILAQRYSRNGEKLGPQIVVSSFRKAAQGGCRVAVAPDGRFLVVWQRRETAFPANPFAIDVIAELFSPLGVKIGGEIRLGPVAGFSELFPEAAADANGNFLAVWSSFRRENGVYGFDIRGQLFRRDGRPVGKEFRVNTRQTGNEFSEPKVAFGGNGTFVVTWNARDGDFDGVFAQRFAASAGDEPCVVRGSALSCDTGHSGGAAELQLTLAGGTITFGDVDRDGRKDPCVFQAGRFQCDTDHRGAPYELSLSFGAAGDVPLFGDVDGDGRDEPCLRRGRLTLCDTRHNGGRAETQFQIGETADQPLMGDLNGDGRDEACVFQAGRFSCDTKHNGGADITIIFGQAGDVAALGDYDGDGDDDPCVFRGGRLLCDLTHNGGAAEAELVFGQAGDRPLLGNLDGV